jgi:3-oxoacyl-(acyl-carrier-protein) synthase
MNHIFVQGCGAVSPAGWGVPALCHALQAAEPLPAQTLPGPDGRPACRARTVPAPATRLAPLSHPRLRRASAISQFALAAALEALEAGSVFQAGFTRLGIVTGTHAACLRYSERFYAEVLRDPATASPLLFPETVVNAPASHLAAYLGGAALTYSLIGDQTAFVQALAVAAGWLVQDRVDLCLVVGAEESAWTVASALRRFARAHVHSEGAGAMVLARSPGSSPGIRLERVTGAHLYAGHPTRLAAAKSMRGDFPPAQPHELLVDARCGSARVDQAETAAWQDWHGLRLSPRATLGEGLGAATAWQCVAACAALAAGAATAANVSVVGGNLQALGARFEKAQPSKQS